MSETGKSENPVYFKLWDTPNPPAVGRLKVNSERCWNSRTSRSRCTECTRACPAECISLDPRVNIDEKVCHSCGLCVAACPTGAILFPRLFTRQFMSALPGGDTEGATPSQVVLTCSGAKEAAEGNGVGPNPFVCLAALDESHLVSLLKGGTGEVILDGRNCGSCSFQKGAEFIKARVEKAQAMAQSLGIPGRVEFSTNLRPDIQNGAEPIPLLNKQTLSRRELFSFLRKTDNEERAGKQKEEIDTEDGEDVELDTQEELRLLHRLNGGGLGYSDPPAKPSILPVRFVRALKNCTLCGSCSIICPGGALEQSEDRFQATLTFNPLKCLGCPLCGEICPHDAFESRPLEKGDFPLKAPRVVFARKKIICVKCERPFISVELNSECPNCEKLTGLDDAMEKILDW